MLTFLAAVAVLLVAAGMGWSLRRRENVRQATHEATSPLAVDLPVIGAPTGEQAAATLPSFRFRDGVTCLAVCILAQWGAWLVIAVVAAYRSVPSGRAEMLAVIYRVTPVAFLLANASGALALFFMLRRLARRLTWDVLRTEARLVPGPLGTSGLALGAGLLVGLAVVSYTLIGPRDTPAHAEWTLQVLVRSREGRLAWIVAAVLMAGPIEEILFRGVLLTAFSKVARASIAGLASAFAFWLFHLPRVLDLWPTGAFVAVVAAILTVLRLRTRSLGPPIAAHVGYNLALALVVLRAV